MRVAGFSPRFRWLTITDAPSAWRKPFASKSRPFSRKGAKDPRIVGFVTVTGVEVTHDLRHAKVFVSVMGTETEQRSDVRGAREPRAASARRVVAKSLALRFAPEIEFRHDQSVARAARIETLLAQVKSERLELEADG